MIDALKHPVQRSVARITLVATLVAALAASLAACGEQATLPLSAGIGARPTLPAPVNSTLPTVNIAPAVGWPPGAGAAGPAGAP